MEGEAEFEQTRGWGGIEPPVEPFLSEQFSEEEMPFYPEVRKLAKIKELFSRFKQENERISSSDMSRCSGSLRESMLLTYASKQPSHASLESKLRSPSLQTPDGSSPRAHTRVYSRWRGPRRWE